MKLLSVIHGPTWGGAHNQAAALARPLAELGVETTVLLPLEGEAAARRLEAAAVAARRLPLSRLRATADPRPNLRLAARSPAQIRAIGKLIDELGVDVVQAHGPTNPQAAMATRGRPVAVAWQLLDSRTPPPLVRLTMPYVVRRADVIATWGEALAELHPPARSLGERCVTVFPPVDSARFAPDEARRAAARARLGIESGSSAPVVGSVGVLTPQKGHEHLIEAAGVLAARGGPPPPLRLIGAPSAAHPAYVESLRDRAAALGRRTGADIGFADPGDEVHELLQAIDIFVLASVGRSEGMPTAILEAMVAGKPVVATNVGAVAELVADGVTGILVPAAEPRALADAIERLSVDAGLRSRMGAAGRARALAEFSIEELARRHHRAYELALRHRRGR